MNDMFVGTNAENMDISAYLKNNPEFLSIAVLDPAAGLAIGDRGVARGDGSVADAISNILNTNVNFNAAGNFASQVNTISRYAQAFMSNVASQASITQAETNTAYSTFKTSMELLTSKTGVNVDEETAKMLVYQNQYEAAAQVVSTIQQMLDALIAAMR